VSRSFSDFLMASSFLNSNNCSGSVLLKNWRLGTVLAASCIQVITGRGVRYKEDFSKLPPDGCKTIGNTAANFACASGQLRAKPPVFWNNYLKLKIKTTLKNLRNYATHVLAKSYQSPLSMDRSNLIRRYL